MTNKLVVIVNSLKVPKIKKYLKYEMKFFVPNYSCLQNPWLGGYRPQITFLSVLWSQLNLLTHPHPPNKISGYATVYIYIYNLRSLKFALKHLKCSYMFRSHDHLEGAYTVPCWSYNLKHSVNYFVMLTVVLWQRVVLLCVSRTLFRMSLVMFVRRVLCSVILAHVHVLVCVII